jgi:plasmid stabilization system protein ParE
VSVFYRPDERWIDVVRVLHHARHLPPLLEDL